MTKNQRVEYQGNIYIVDGGVAYETKRISWRPVHYNDEYFILLSENIVDVRNGGEDLLKWLNDSFWNNSFTEKEQAGIEEIRLLTDNDISTSQVSDLLIFKDSDTHWWLNSRSSGALQKVVKKDGTIYNSGYNFRTKKSGVRPVIRVKKEFITSLK